MKLPKPNKRRTFRRRNRDYKAEYAKRINNPAKQALPLSVRRGHARAGERPKPPGPPLIDPKSREELAVKMVADGGSLRTAARTHGLSEERLRRYLRENTDAQRVAGKWEIADSRLRQFPIYSNGVLTSPWLNREETSKAARFMQVVKAFLADGDPAWLTPYRDRGVRDVRGKFHPFEVNENTLYELDQAGELSFPEYYRIVA